MKIFKKVAFFIVAAILVTPVAVFAQNSDEEPGSGGISISPTRFEFVIERGASELVSLQLENVTQGPIVAKAFLNDFEPDGNSGSPKLIIGSENKSSSSLRDFISGLDDLFIEKGETINVDIPLYVPEDAAPGAYYGALRFQVAPGVDGEEASQDAAQLSLNASVAALVLVSVPGDITEKIEVLDVSAYLNDKSGSIFTKKPTQVGIEINNLGNGFSKPFGSVIVNGPWGAGQVFDYELNDTSPRGNVLPNSQRLFFQNIEGVSAPGRYTIVANISHGNGGEILEAKSTFWYLPAWFLLTVLAVVLLLAGAGYYLYRKYVTKTTKRRRR